MPEPIIQCWKEFHCHETRKPLLITACIYFYRSYPHVFNGSSLLSSRNFPRSSGAFDRRGGRFMTCVRAELETSGRPAALIWPGVSVTPGRPPDPARPAGRPTSPHCGHRAPLGSVRRRRCDPAPLPPERWTCHHRPALATARAGSALSCPVVAIVQHSQSLSPTPSAGHPPLTAPSSLFPCRDSDFVL